MYKIIKKRLLVEDTYLMELKAPRLAKSTLPGQFLIVKAKKTSERIPLSIVDSDSHKGTVTIVFKAIGKSTYEMATYNEGDAFADVVGPLGMPSEINKLTDRELKSKKYLFIGGGVGVAPLYSQVKYLFEKGAKANVIIGAKTKSLLIFEEEMAALADTYITTDDGSTANKGLVTDMLKKLIESGKEYDEIVAIGPLIMMKFVVQIAKEHRIKCTVSLNSIMVDGTGMCGACRVTVGGEMRFTCVDGPEFDGWEVDFDEALKRQAMYSSIEGKKQIENEEKAEGHVCYIGGVTDESRDNKKRVPVSELSPDERITHFDEVCLGYTAEEAIIEAQRCIQCKEPKCVEACLVHINIPGFIQKIAEGNFEESARIINRDSTLPAVCGRVCPQETLCEGACVMGKKYEPIAIGKLERFVGDYSRENNIQFEQPTTKNNHKVAIIGSGPAGISCAKELLLKGYDVTVFEALHEYGGVLVYGIPSFRLPNTVVKHEIENVAKMGAIFEKNVVVGRTVTVNALMKEENFKAVFIASGAGLPNFMNIEGENLNGVVSANEFLTRNNLLFSYKRNYNTPNYVGKNVIVIGGGNVAMDAARTARRLGAEVQIAYRRSEEEMPARLEEIHHTKEEGVTFKFLCNPLRIIGDEKGWVQSIECIRMQLTEPDASGRRKPVEIVGSEFNIPTDMVIMAIGNSPNPIVAQTTTGVEVDKRNRIIVDENGQTTREGVFAGGDAVDGAATVIFAMGTGKKAAIAIDNYIRNLK